MSEDEKTYETDDSANATSNSSMLYHNDSSIDDSSLISEQEVLYGHIAPAPQKSHEPKSLPPLDGKLVIPRKRPSSKSSSTGSAPFETPSQTKKAHFGIRSHARPSTPGKTRNFTSPMLSRIPSITASPIPDLNPYSQTESPESHVVSRILTPQSIKNNRNSPIAVRNFSAPTISHRKITQIQQKLNQAIEPEVSTAISESDYLDSEILKFEAKLATLKKGVIYLEEQNETKLQRLKVKWQEIARKASNYFLNEAKTKIERMGGIEVYREQKKKSKLRKMKFEFDQNLLYSIEDYIESDEYKDLGKYEKEEILQRKKEIEDMSNDIENGKVSLDDGEDENLANEFDMNELCKQLNVDYELIWGKL